MSSYYHVVAFKLKPELGEAEKQELKERFLSLKTGCQKDGKPYMLSVKGGNQTNESPMSQGMDLVFVIEFTSEDDLHYYHKEDPYHRNFIPKCIEYTAAGIGLDFSD